MGEQDPRMKKALEMLATIEDAVDQVAAVLGRGSNG